MLLGALRNIVLIGAPGVGKGTFAKLIASETGWKHVSMGDILRKEVKDGTSLGKEVEGILRRGGLVSDALINAIAYKQLNFVEKSYNQTTDRSLELRWGRGVLLDGYPRTIGQAVALTNQIVDTDKRGTCLAVQIVLEPWVAIQKMLHRRQCVTCGDSFNTADIVQDGYDMPAILPNKSTCRMGKDCLPNFVNRNDDTTEIIESRMLEYGVKTAPIIEYYQQRGELCTFHVKKGVKDTPQLLQLIREHIIGPSETLCR